MRWLDDGYEVSDTSRNVSRALGTRDSTLPSIFLYFKSINAIELMSLSVIILLSSPEKPSYERLRPAAIGTTPVSKVERI